MTDEYEYPKVDGDTVRYQDMNSWGGILTTTAGENLTADEVVYIKETDGQAYISDNANYADSKVDGIVLNTASSGNACYVQTSGVVGNLSGLTAKEVYYLGAAGALTTTDNNIPVGVAVTTTALKLLKNINSAPTQYSTVDGTTDDSAGGAWGTLNEMTITITTGGSPVLVLFTGGGFDTTGANTAEFRIDVDGTPYDTGYGISDGNADNVIFNVAMHQIFELTPGSHTFKIEWTGDGTLNNCSTNPNVATRRLSVIELGR